MTAKTLKIVARISLKQIADECRIDAKKARILLRKSDLKKHDDNWSFVEAELARVRTLLNPKMFPATPTVKAPRKPRAVKAVKAAQPAPAPSDLNTAPAE